MSLGYLSHEVLDVRANFERILNGQQSDFIYEAEGEGTIATPWKRTGSTKRRLRLPFLLGTIAEITAFRKFVDRRRGPQRAFWLPAYLSDFELADFELPGINKIRTLKNGYAAKWAAGNQFRHAAMLSPTVLDCYGVTAVAVGATEETLTITPILANLVTRRTILCPLLLVRFNESVQFSYASGKTALLNLELLEVPAEVPAPGGPATVNTGSRPLYLYEFTIGGTVTRFCNWSVNVTAGGQSWTAENIKHGEVSASLDFIGNDIDLTIRTRNNSHLMLNWLDRLNMKNADLQIFETDADTLTFTSTAPVYAGRIESVEYSEDGQINARCSSLFRSAEARVPRINIQRTCNHRTFDAGCGLNEALFTTSGTISAINVDPAYVEATAFGAKVTATGDADWFALGKVIAAGETRLCTGTDGANRLYLNAPFKTAIVGNTISATAGDNKRVGTCNQKFNNLPNFMGWPYIPSRNPQFRALETPKAPGGKKS